MKTTRIAVAALIMTAGSGCSFEGPWLQTWWGDLAGEAETASFQAGDSSALAGLAFDRLVGDEVGTGVVLLGSWAPGSCDIHTDHMRELDALRTAAAGVALDADGAAWICERLDGLARESYGGEGDHRAVHAVVGPGEPEGARLVPAPAEIALDQDGALDPATLPGAGEYVARVLEWGAPQLPGAGDEPGGRCTAAVLGAWAEEGATAADGVRAGAFRVYHHRFLGEENVAQAGAEAAPVGFATEGWSGAATGGASTVATIFTDAPAIAGSTFPQMVAGTRGDAVDLAPCDAAAAYGDWAFPELEPAAEGAR